MSAPYEVPTEIRDFAERSVSQARKAFEGFIGAVQKTTGNFDSVGITATSSAKDVATKAVTYAETNVGAAFDLAEKLVRAKDLQEVMALQSEYLKAQFEALQAQTKDLSETVQKVAATKA
jgi:phasin